MSVELLPVCRAADLDPRPAAHRWLIEPLWGHGAVGLIGGTPKSLKTWLGLEMAVSVSTGTPCLDAFDVGDPGPALVYLAEERWDVVRERLEALCEHRGHGLDKLDVHVVTVPSLRLDLQRDVDRLDATIGHHRPRMLLLDPFVRLHRSDENQVHDVAAILASLRELQRRHEVAVVVAHHSRKNGSARQHGQALRGSGDFHAWADSALYLTHERELLRLTVEHRAAPAPPPCHLRLETEPLHLRLVVPEQTPKETLEDRIVSALRQSAAPIPRTELRQALAVNNNRLGPVLEDLERKGLVQRTALGWAIP